MAKIDIMSLGGLNENGKNLYTVSIDGKILIFDCGMKYAPDKMYGVDYVIPDFEYLIQRRKDIVGIFISHPHHENMGALTDLVSVIPEINVYCSKYTSKIVEYEVERYNIRFKNKSNYTIVVSDNYENNEVILKLSEEVRKREETSNIVLKPGEEFNTEATFSKYSDDGDDSQSIMFSSVRIMENYSGIENVDEETIKNEIDNAIKMSMEVKIAK